MAAKKYDSTVARIAGNIAAGLVNHYDRSQLNDSMPHDWIVMRSVSLARAIVAEVERTEPQPEPIDRSQYQWIEERGGHVR